MNILIRLLIPTFIFFIKSQKNMWIKFKIKFQLNSTQTNSSDQPIINSFLNQTKNIKPIFFKQLSPIWIQNSTQAKGSENPMLVASFLNQNATVLKGCMRFEGGWKEESWPKWGKIFGSFYLALRYDSLFNDECRPSVWRKV